MATVRIVTADISSISPSSEPILAAIICFPLKNHIVSVVINSSDLSQSDVSLNENWGLAAKYISELLLQLSFAIK